METAKNLDDDNGIEAVITVVVVLVEREENCRLTEWLSTTEFSKTVFFTALHIPPIDDFYSTVNTCIF